MALSIGHGGSKQEFMESNWWGFLLLMSVAGNTFQNWEARRICSPNFGGKNQFKLRLVLMCFFFGT